MSEGNSIRVSRGGSWDVGPQYARVVVRGSGDPGDRGTGLGVRLVEEVVEEVDEDLTPESWSFRPLRGGSWCLVPQLAWVADRGSVTPDWRNNRLGIRLVGEVTDV
jgi:formylglycine-generating enzyme required for sulfatase activity